MNKKITSTSNPIIKNILSNSLSDDMFFVFGEKIIKEIISFNYKIKTLFVLESKIDLLDEYIHENTKQIILISKEVSQKLCINRKEWIFAIFQKNKEPEIEDYKNAILLDNIQHPNNLGLIIRTALGLGIDKIFLLQGVNKYNPKLISSSSSYCLCAKVRQIKSLSEIKLDDKRIICTALSKNSKDIKNVTKKEIGDNWVLVFGNEGKGVSEQILNISDLTLNIKMLNNIDSLNVSICASIVLWEILNKV